MNSEVDKKPEVSDVSAWIALYHRAATMPSTPLVRPEEYDALISGVSDRRDRAILLVLRESGLRATELVHLDRDMISYETHTLSDGSIGAVGIGSVTSAKSQQKRQFFLSSEAVEAVKEYLLADRGHDTDRVLFAGRRGGRLSPISIRRLLYESCDRLGIERFALHEFRRSLAAELCKNGSDLRAIKSALGYRKTEAVVDLISQSNPKAN